MTLSQAVAKALEESIQAIKEETQYKETDNTIAEVKYFERQVQGLLKQYMVHFISKGDS